jgi:AcrR family transcriptional regulator
VSTPPKYKRLNADERRDQLLDVANALLAERGYEEVTVEHIAKSAGVARGLVHHYFGGRKEVYLALLERVAAGREDDLRPPLGTQCPGTRRDSVSRWLDWTEANATLYLGTIAPGEDIADPDVRRVGRRPGAPRRRADRGLPRRHRRGLPRLRYALTCWTGLNRAATRRWLRGEASREATHELLASTLEHVLRTFGSSKRTGAATS